MDNYNPKVTLSVDVTKAVNNLNGVLEQAQKLKDTIENGATLKLTNESAKKSLDAIQKEIKKINETLSKGNGKDSLINTDSTKNALKDLTNQVDKTKRDIEKNPADLGHAINIDSLTESLRRVTNELRGALSDAIDRVINKMTDLSQVGQIFHDERDLQHLREMSNRLGEMEAKIEELSSRHLTVADARAKDNVDAINEKLQDVKNDLLQMENVKLEVTSDEAQNNAQTLLNTLERIREVVEQISSHPIDVNVTNEGFNTLIENFNRASTVLDKIIKRTATLVKKQQESTAEMQKFGNIAGDSAEGMQMVASATEAAARAERQLGVTSEDAAESNDRIAQIALRISTLQREAAAQKEKEARAAKELAEAQRLYSNTIAKANRNLAQGFGNARRISNETGKAKSNVEKLSSVLLKTFYSARGVAEVFQQVQGFAYNIASYIENIGSRLVGTIIPATKSLVSQGFEFASNIENAKISYRLFFPNEDPSQIIKTINERAILNPVFDTSDLSKYVAQLAPLSGGDSQLVIDAVEGIAAMIKASGGDVSTYMQKLVTNTQQIVSTGKATVRDWNEFLRATPVFEQVLAEVTPELRKKLNNENAEITKDDTTQLLKALQLVRTDSSIADVLEETAQNWDSLVQQTKEAIQTTMGNMAIDSGLYRQMKNVLKENSRFTEALQKYLTPLMEGLSSFIANIDWDEVEGVLGDLVQIAKTTLKDILEIFGLDTSEFSVKDGRIDAKTIRTFIKNAFQFFMDFIKGFARGIKNVIDATQWLMKTLNINSSNVGDALGWLASPGGLLTSRFLNAITGATQLVANLWSGLKSFAAVIQKLNPFEATELTSLLQKKFGNVAGKLTTAIKGAIIGVIGYALSNAANELIYTIGKSLGDGNYVTAANAVGGAVEVAGSIASGALGGAAIGSAIAPGVGTAIGTVLGGALSGIISIIDVISKTNQRIEQETAAIQTSLKSDYEKLIDKDAPNAAKGFLKDLNSILSQQNASQIDLGSKAGYYAQERLEAYMKNTPAAEWDVNEMARIAQNAYYYKKMVETLDDYTESAEFRGLTGGGTFNYKTDLTTRDRLADMIKDARLLGDYYSYGAAEQIVEDYLNGHSMTYDQINALLDKYNAEKKEVDKQTNILSNVEFISTTLDDMKTAIENFGKTFPNYSQTLGEIKTELENIYQYLDGKKYGVNAWGQMYEIEEKTSTSTDKNTKALEKATDILVENGKRQAIANGMSEKAANTLFNTDIVKKAQGGIIRRTVRPVYKASGGALGVDTIPVMAQQGEFIVRRSVVEKVGLPAMTALNLGDTKLAATLMGRPNISNATNSNISNNDNDNRKYIRQFVKVVNRNHSSSLNSAYSLANRLALG